MVILRVPHRTKFFLYLHMLLLVMGGSAFDGRFYLPGQMFDDNAEVKIRYYRLLC